MTCTSLNSSCAKTSITPSSSSAAAPAGAWSKLALLVEAMPVTAPWSSLLASPLRFRKWRKIGCVSNDRGVPTISYLLIEAIFLRFLCPLMTPCLTPAAAPPPPARSPPVTEDLRSRLCADSKNRTRTRARLKPKTTIKMRSFSFMLQFAKWFLP